MGEDEAEEEASSSYSITETYRSDYWTLTDAACTLEDGTETGVMQESGIIDVTILEGQTTTCTFQNTQTGSGQGAPGTSPYGQYGEGPADTPEPDLPDLQDFYNYFRY